MSVGMSTNKWTMEMNDGNGVHCTMFNAQQFGKQSIGKAFYIFFLFHFEKIKSLPIQLYARGMLKKRKHEKLHKINSIISN